MNLGTAHRPYTVLVGDVHGCLNELVRLLQQVGVHANFHRLVFLGDLVDRGPDPVGVLRLVRMLWCSGFECWSVKGNHEQKHLLYADREERRLRDGTPNLMKYDDKRKAEFEAFSKSDLVWMRERMFPFVRFVAGCRPWIATHAGVPSDLPIEDQPLEKLCRTRFVKKATGKYTSTGNAFEVPPDAQPWYERWSGPENVVFGHSVVGLEKPQVYEREGVTCFGLDTGCVFGGHLTAMVLDNETGQHMFEQVKANAVYSEKNPLHWNE